MSRFLGDPERVGPRLGFVPLLIVVCAISVSAQRGTPPGPPPTPKAAAPIDITGNWVSVVTEDWRWRMLTPKKGDTSRIPVRPEGKRNADPWDPPNAPPAGCQTYGAA